MPPRICSKRVEEAVEAMLAVLLAARTVVARAVLLAASGVGAAGAGLMAVATGATGATGGAVAGRWRW